MKKAKLNGWQYIGIILSVVWALWAGIHTHIADNQAANGYADLRYKTCTNEKLLSHDNNLSSCDQGREKDIKQWLEWGGGNGNAVLTALVPIPFGWLLGFILIYVGRAQVIGFRTVIQWTKLSQRKKLFASFCTLVGFLVVLSSVVAILNLYVDTVVPVSLSSFVDVDKNGDDFVTVQGTWTRTDLTNDSIMNPLQTSKIECNRQTNKCTEANASVSGNVLTSDLVEYDIESWTPASIVFRREELCGTTVFTIDLNTKTVSGAGHLTNQENISCKMGFKSKDDWTFLLTNGFNVYWELRNKARPALLKIIQAMFGH